MISYHAFTHAVRPIRISLHLRLKSPLGRCSIRLYSITSIRANDQGGLLRALGPRLISSAALTYSGSNIGSSISAEVRTLMRSTPHPLTTIISYASESSGPDSDPKHTLCALLVSSFNTVTLDPKPYVSFNIKRPSRTYDAIYQSGSFTASCMSDATVAQAFVKNGGSRNVWEQMVGGAGKLKEGKGSIWWMSCALMQSKCVEIEDHVIIVGEVVDAAAYQAGEGEMGLIYVDGKYRRVGIAVSIDEKYYNGAE